MAAPLGFAFSYHEKLRSSNQALHYRFIRVDAGMFVVPGGVFKKLARHAQRSSACRIPGYSIYQRPHKPQRIEIAGEFSRVLHATVMNALLFLFYRHKRVAGNDCDFCVLFGRTRPWLLLYRG